MDAGNLRSAVQGVAGAADLQKMASEMTSRPIEQAGSSSEIRTDVQNPSKTELAKAVTGVGTKIDITV